MLTELICNIFFDVLNVAFGWIPAEAELILSEKITNIFGYGVWLLGDDFFTALSVIAMGEVAGLVAWSLFVFAWRFVRG